MKAHAYGHTNADENCPVRIAVSCGMRDSIAEIGFEAAEKAVAISLGSGI